MNKNVKIMTPDSKLNLVSKVVWDYAEYIIQLFASFLEGGSAVTKNPDKKSFFETLSTFIVDKRNLIFFIYIAAIIFSAFASSWVRVNSDLTSYLPANTETRKGLEIMNTELTTFGSARVMVTHVTYGLAADLAEQIIKENN